jgi:hypothetical protein
LALGVLERVLLAIPGRGVGFVDGPGGAGRPWSATMDNPNLVAAQVVSVRQGDTTFTVTVLASDSRQTVVEYTASGLPQTEEPGLCSSPGGNSRPPLLRDGEGREYAAQAIYGDVCIRADGLYRGGASFPSLPLDLRSIEVVVPIAYAVPSSWRGPGRSPSPSCSPHRSRPGPP